MKIAPGVRVNLGKRGPSVTVGGKAGRVTMGPSGTHVGASLPGTGVYFSQKVGSTANSSSKTASPRTTSTAPAQEGSLESLLRAVPPKESGTGGVIAALSSSPKRAALKTIRRVASSASPDDSAVQAAVAQAPDSWTVQREAGLYFVKRANPGAALAHLAKAATLFPGDRTLYLLVAADSAIDAENYEYATAALEPYVSAVDPEGDIGALILTTLANAHLTSGDASRAAELLGRLPLRKRNLSETLLYALCVRARANRALGKKAQAKKDIDRVYSYRPDFPMLADASREALAE